MAHGFERQEDRDLTVTLEPFEQVILSSLLDQVAHMLAPHAPVTLSEDPLAALMELTPEIPVVAPEDPVLARLLPDAYRDDAEMSAEFRRFTEMELRRDKVQRIAIVRTSLTGLPEPIVVPMAQAQDWLRSLNDVRLALGTRLGVSENDDERWLAADEAPVREVYDWLGWLQESLLRALMDLGDPTATP